MKTLQEIIKENKQYITTNNVCYCLNGIVCARYKIDELDNKQLNKRYHSQEWFIEDNELCIIY